MNRIFKLLFLSFSFLIAVTSSDAQVIVNSYGDNYYKSKKLNTIELGYQLSKYERSFILYQQSAKLKRISQRASY